jgi:hypothetical protein
MRFNVVNKRMKESFAQNETFILSAFYLTDAFGFQSLREPPRPTSTQFSEVRSCVHVPKAAQAP